jgi:outer membrane protein
MLQWANFFNGGDMYKILNRINLVLCCLMVILLWGTCLKQSIYAQSADETLTLPLSLNDCIKLTLRNNLLIQQQRLTPQIDGRQITMEKAAFDPDLTLEIKRDYAERLSPTALAGAAESRTENNDVNIGIEKKLSTGGTLGLDFSNNRSETNSSYQTINPYYESVLSLNLIQPLLKDFGISVNESQINIAVNNHQISILKLQQELISTLSQSQKLYWDLVFNMQNLEVKNLLLEQARDLLEKNKARVEVGLAVKVDVLEAEADVAARQEEVVVAQYGVKDTEDKLKQITNILSEPNRRQLALVPTEEPMILPQKLDMEQTIVLALDNRAEYNQSQLELKNSRINLLLAKNGILPEVNLSGNIGYSGLGKDFNDDWDELSNTDHPVWGVGVNFKFPLGNRFASNERIQRELEQEQAGLRIKEIELQIILEVRQALRQLQTNLKRIDSTKIAQELEQEKLKIEEERFELGMTTSHDLLEFQTDLATAKSNHLKAIIDYNKSFIDLDVATGTMLKKHNIELKELYPST